MHARSTTFTGRPASVDAGIAFVRERVEPAVLQVDGCTGLSLLVDRPTGRSIVTTGWVSEEALHDSEPRVAVLRAEAAQVFGSRPEVRRWDIAVLHRLRPTDDGAAARVVWLQVDPGVRDEHLRVVRSTVLPVVESFAGFCGMSVLVERSSGTAAAATTFRSRQHLAASRELAADLRAAVLRRLSAELLEVAELDVALAHLRVPETV